MVGTSGACDARWALLTPNAFSLPAFTCGSAVTILSKIIETWPESRSV